MADKQEGKPHVTVKFDPVLDNGLVTRESETYTPDGGGWAKAVTYKDAAGNYLRRVKSATERGAPADFDEITTHCVNGAIIPPSKEHQINVALLEGHKGLLWTSTEHDFGDSNPLRDACAIAPKPRKR